MPQRYSVTANCDKSLNVECFRDWSCCASGWYAVLVDGEDGDVPTLRLSEIVCHPVDEKMVACFHAEVENILTFFEGGFADIRTGVTEKWFAGTDGWEPNIFCDLLSLRIDEFESLFCN